MLISQQLNHIKNEVPYRLNFDSWSSSIEHIYYLRKKEDKTWRIRRKSDIKILLKERNEN